MKLKLLNSQRLNSLNVPRGDNPRKRDDPRQLDTWEKYMVENTFGKRRYNPGWLTMEGAEKRKPSRFGKRNRFSFAKREWNPDEWLTMGGVGKRGFNPSRLAELTSQ